MSKRLKCYHELPPPVCEACGKFAWKTRAEERLIKAAIKFMAGKEEFPWTMLSNAVDPVLKERAKK